MSNTKSIYNTIKELIQSEGKLPANFSPETKKLAPGKLPFAPGALEGILGHHTRGDGGKTHFPSVLRTYVDMEPQAALQDFEEKLADDFSAATEGKTVLKTIMENQSMYPPSKVLTLAYYFAANGKRTEAVKLGLTLMRLFDTTKVGKGEFADLLLHLGYCEEFTGYVLDNTYVWTDEARQELIYKLAKALNGWGKINTVEMLKVDTPEKKNWVLCYGCRNSVMYNYLAAVCLEKSELYKRLQEGNLSKEEFRGATDIMEGLVDEGPSTGLSDVDEPTELTLLYLAELKKQELDIELIDFIAGLKGYFANNSLDRANEVITQIDDIMSTVDIDDVIEKNLETHTFQALRTATFYKIDKSERLLELMKKNMKKYFNVCGYILSNGTKVDEFFALCDEQIDEKDYPIAMGSEMMFGAPKDDRLPLDMVVQYLDKFPLKGKKLIKICINSPITRWRNMAAKALIGWQDELGKHLPQIDEELAELVVSVHAKECVEDTRKMWSKLL